jgi:hypothetical protein
MRLPFAAKSKQVQTFNSPATNKVHWNMPDKQLQVPLSTVASFAEHLTEMLDHLHDVPEFKKRHGPSLIRLRDGLAGTHSWFVQSLGASPNRK